MNRELNDLISLFIGAGLLILVEYPSNTSKLSLYLLQIGCIIIILTGFGNLIFNQTKLLEQEQVPSIIAILAGLAIILAIIGFTMAEFSLTGEIFPQTLRQLQISFWVLLSIEFVNIIMMLLSRKK
ncbi:MAG: hypothetical protein INQ03_08585 [Candidatus Heimdallarchaeota archaeon]|nr:hypothetical protein [Candidatus Heimdallarchaeota archaeon]